MEKKVIKMGVFGGARGSHFYRCIEDNGGEIVAVCDFSDEALEKAKSEIGGSVATYRDFDAFIAHEGLEAIMVSNYFHEHATFAIAAMEKGIHVISECTSNGTMAEGVALVRAQEKTGAVYMLAENYPFMLFNQEMKRVYDSGVLGRALYCEGEYNHPVNPADAKGIATLCPSSKHWRFHLPRTYYITHALAPLMYITGRTPVRVSALPVLSHHRDMFDGAGRGVPEKAAIITCLNDDRSVFRVTGCAAFGAHEKSYRICGENGQMENVRNGTDDVLISYNPWQIPDGQQEHNTYTPVLVDEEKEKIERAGHGGGDYFVIREFFNAIREGRQPCFDVYFATTMASVAIMAHRSMLEDGVPYDVPDLRREEDRVKYESDTLSPFYGTDGTAPSLPGTNQPDFWQTPAGMAQYDEMVKRVTAK